MLLALLGAGAGALLKALIGHQEALVVLKEGWPLMAAKFRIGQTTGGKFDAEMVAGEMRRAQDTDDKGLHLEK